MLFFFFNIYLFFFHIARKHNLFCGKTWYFFMALCNILFLFLHCSTCCLQYYTLFLSLFYLVLYHKIWSWWLWTYYHGEKGVMPTTFLLFGAVNFPPAFDYLPFYFYRVCYTFSFLSFMCIKIFFFQGLCN